MFGRNNKSTSGSPVKRILHRLSSHTVSALLLRHLATGNEHRPVRLASSTIRFLLLKISRLVTEVAVAHPVGCCAIMHSECLLQTLKSS
jgi:hypothetical protein